MKAHNLLKSMGLLEPQEGALPVSRNRFDRSPALVDDDRYLFDNREREKQLRQKARLFRMAVTILLAAVLLWFALSFNS